MATHPRGTEIRKTTRIAFKTVLEMIPRLSSVKQIRFVLFNEADQRLHARVVEELSAPSQA